MEQINGAGPLLPWICSVCTYLEQFVFSPAWSFGSIIYTDTFSLYALITFTLVIFVGFSFASQTVGKAASGFEPMF